MNFVSSVHLPIAGASLYAEAPDFQIESDYVAPIYLDNRPRMLPSSNQGETSQCVAYSISGRIEMERWARNGDARQIDPAPIYNEAKKIDGLPPGSEGTFLECGLQAAVNLNMMSYVPGSLAKITRLDQLTRALHRDGAVTACFAVTDNWFRTRQNGWIDAGGNIVGYHAVLLTGYDLRDGVDHYVSGQNSWGQIGWHGHFRLHLDAFATQFQYGLTWTSL